MASPSEASSVESEGSMPRGAKPRVYPPKLVALVCNLYERNHTQSEIATKLGTTQKVIWNLMRRHGIAGVSPCPTWMEWYQGLPDGWLNELPETASSRCAHRSPGKSSTC